MGTRRPIPVQMLRQQVYDLLRDQIRRGILDPGTFLDLNALAASLGVSRTPLRDALLQLEAEDFVTISPRRGVRVKALEASDIRELYQMLGALEATALRAAAPLLAEADLAHLEDLADRDLARVEAGDFDGHYELNLAFHDLFLVRCGNGRIIRLVHLQKQRLYEWIRAFRMDLAWERSNLVEHREILRLLRKGRPGEAADYLREVHWGFAVQAPFIQEMYFS